MTLWPGRRRAGGDRLPVTCPSLHATWCAEIGNQPPHVRDLVFADRVIHPGIQDRRHVAADVPEHLGGFLDTRRGDVRVHVAAPEEHRGAVERPGRGATRCPAAR